MTRKESSSSQFPKDTPANREKIVGNEVTGLIEEVKGEIIIVSMEMMGREEVEGVEGEDGEEAEGIMERIENPEWKEKRERRDREGSIEMIGVGKGEVEEEGIGTIGRTEDREVKEGKEVREVKE